MVVRVRHRHRWIYDVTVQSRSHLFDRISFTLLHVVSLVWLSSNKKEEEEKGGKKGNKKKIHMIGFLFLFRIIDTPSKRGSQNVTRYTNEIP